MKGEPRKEEKIVEIELHLLAHNRSAFDTFIDLNNSPNYRRLINVKQNGKSNFLKIFSSYLKKSKNKTVPKYNSFRCLVAHIKTSLKNRYHIQPTGNNI